MYKNNTKHHVSVCSGLTVACMLNLDPPPDPAVGLADAEDGLDGNHGLTEDSSSESSSRSFLAIALDMMAPHLGQSLSFLGWSPSVMSSHL